jgi:hypothetical protein
VAGIARTAFTDLRSWLRNALEFEATPAAHTSDVLAGAVRQQAAHRLEGTPLDGTIPSLRARAARRRAGRRAVTGRARPRSRRPTPWNPGARCWAPGRRHLPSDRRGTRRRDAGLRRIALHRARIEGSLRPPKLTGEGAAPAPVLESSEGDQRRWRFDLPP